MIITEMHHVTAGMLSQKPLLGPKLGHPPLSARERAAARWFSREKPPISTTAASGEVFPGQYYDQETGLLYNQYRYYSADIGRYITADPLGIIIGQTPAPTLPQKLSFYIQSLPNSSVLAGGLNHLYVYVENNPVNMIDPLGLYGTTSCSYYEQRCEQVGGVYYCYLAPAVCENTPPGPWANCVRQCLQEFDKGYCDPCDKDTICIINIHQMCWQECIGGGPPETYPE